MTTKHPATRRRLRPKPEPKRHAGVGAGQNTVNLIAMERSMKRRQARSSNGRYRRSALTDAGLRGGLCLHCFRFNPTRLEERPAKDCRHCGYELTVTDALTAAEEKIDAE